MRILCVDDEEFWRGFIKHQLRDHHVDAVGTLREAVDLLHSQPGYAVALVDLNLHAANDGEGGELLNLLRLRFPNTKRIALTAYLAKEAITKFMTRYDIDELIIKRDFQLSDLRQAIEHAMETKRD